MANLVVGQRVRIDFETTNDDGLLADPPSLSLIIKRPSGRDVYIAGTAAEIVRTGTGIYRAQVLLTEPGTWFWEVEIPGADVEPGAFTVQARRTA